MLQTEIERISEGLRKGEYQTNPHQAAAIGSIFGRLKIIRESTKDRFNRRRFVCECLCGKETIVQIGNLKTGHTKSCGCLEKENLLKLAGHNKYRFIEMNNIEDRKFYVTWKNLNSRCFNKKNSRYKNYGGRGIDVMEKWKNFKNFWKDMYPSFKEHNKLFGRNNTNIERIDVNGNYCKENCKWATWKEQANNKTTNRMITAMGKKMNMTQWGEKLGLNSKQIWEKLDKGISIETLWNQNKK